MANSFWEKLKQISSKKTEESEGAKQYAQRLKALGSSLRSHFDTFESGTTEQRLRAFRGATEDIIGSLAGGISDAIGRGDGPRADEYDAQFTPEYFDNDPEKYGRLVDLDYKTASMEDLIFGADTLWKIQAGENYRNNGGESEEEAYARNTSYNRNSIDAAESILAQFKSRATEEEFRAGIDVLKANYEEAGPGNYKDRVGRAIEELEEYGYKNFSGYMQDAQDQLRQNMRGVAYKMDRINNDPASYVDPGFYMDSDTQDRIAFLNGGSYDFSELTPAAQEEYDNFAKQIYDQRIYTPEAQQRISDLETDLVDMKNQYAAGEETLEDQKEWESYAQLLRELDGGAGIGRQLQNRVGLSESIASVPEFTGYSEERTENYAGVGSYTTRANQATLDQIIAHPEQVIDEVGKAVWATSGGADEEAALQANLVSLMTDEERYAYFVIRDTQGPDAAAEYFDMLTERELWARDNARVAEEMRTLADSGPLGAVAASAASVAVKPLATIANLGAAIRGEDNPNAPSRQMSIYGNTARETVGQNIAEAVPMEKVSNFLGFNPLQVAYSGIMSGIDSVVSLAMTGTPAAAAGFQAVGATGEGYMEALDRGLDVNEARILSAGSGAIEYLTEKLPLDKLMKTQPADTIGGFLKNLIMQGASEAGEEGASSIANSVVDWVLTQDESKFTQRYEDLTQNGYSSDSALWKIAGETMKEAAADAFGGFVSGAGMGAGATAIESAQQGAIDAQTGRQIISQGNAEAIIRAAEEYDGKKSKSIKALANRLRAKIESSADGTLPDDAETRAETQVLREELAEEGVEPQEVEAEKPDIKTEVAADVPEATETKPGIVEAEKPDLTIAADVSEKASEVPAKPEVVEAEKPDISKPETQQEEARANNEAISQFTGSPKKLGRLYRRLITALELDVKEAGKAERREAIMNRLEQLGEKASPAVADAIAAAVEGEDLSRKQADILEAAAYAKPVLNELLGSLARNSSDWTSRMTSAETKRKEATVSSLRNATRERISAPEPEAAAEAEVKVSEGGVATVTDGAGKAKEAQIVGIADAVDGVLQAVVKMDGKETTVPLSQVQAESEEQATLISRASQIGDTKAANKMISLFKGGDAAAFADAFTSAYEYGTTGGSYTLEQAKTSARTTGLSAEQIKTAYDLGAARAAAEANESVSFKSGTKGKLTLTGRAASRAAVLDSNQKSAIHALRRIAEVTGVNIEVFESAANEKGEFASENGSFNRETNTIRIDVNAGKMSKASTASYALLRVAGHELTHYIRANNRAGYQALQDFAVQVLAKQDSRNFDDMVAAKQDAYERQFNKQLSYDDAVEEVVADACEMMLKDSTAIQQLAQKNRSLFKRIRSWITNFVNAVKRAFQGVNANSDEAKAMLSRMDELQKMWDDALIQAVENTKAAGQAKAQPKKAKAEAKQTAYAGVHIDGRTDENMQDAQPFFNDFPELYVAYAYPMADIIRGDVAASVPASRTFVWETGTSQPEVLGAKRSTSDLIAKYKDAYGWTWEQMGEYLDKFCRMYESGEELPDYMYIKRIELMVDEALTKGYKDVYGTFIQPVTDYIKEKARIEGSTRDGWQYTDAKNMPDGVSFDEYVGGDTKYSIRISSDGYKYVEVDVEQEQFDGLSNSERRKLAERIIREKFMGKVIGNDYKVYVNGKGANEYAYPAKFLDDPAIVEAKMRSAPELDNLIDAGFNFRHANDGENGHIHENAKDGFTHFETIFHVGEDYYIGRVNVINGKRGRLFKDITQIKSIIPDHVGSSGQIALANIVNNASEVSIAFSEPGVKGKFQLRDLYNLTDRELLIEALETEVTSDKDREVLNEYSKKISRLYDLEEELAPTKQKISEIYRSKGKRDNKKLNQLRAEAASIEEKIIAIDKQLLRIESMESIKNLLKRERSRVRRNARRHMETVELRHKIRAVLDDFNRRLKAPTEKKYIPANFVGAVIAASELINTDSKRGGEKAAAKIAQIRGVYERYKSDPMFNFAYDEVVASMLDNLQQIAGNKSIYQLGRDELQAVYDVVKALKKQVTEAVQLKAGEYGRNIIEVGRDMALDTIAAEPLFKNEKISDLLNWHLSPNRFFARLGGYKKGSAWTDVVADSFNRGTETMYEIQRDFYNHFREFSENKLFDTLTSRKKLVDIGLKDKAGEKIEVTRGMMLSIYMHLLNEDNRRGIMYGGLTIPDLAKYYNGKMGDAYGRGSTMTIGTASDLYAIAKRLREDNLTDAQREALEADFNEAIKAGEERLNRMMTAIEKQLTDFEKRLIKAAQAWNDGKSQQYINDVTMDLYGIKKANVKNYWRIHRDTSFIQTDFDSISKNVNLENWGSLKARVPSQAPVLLTDFAFEMDSNMQQMSRYVGFARAQRDFKKLYNVRLPGMDGSVKKAVASKFGTGKKGMGVTGEQYIENFIGDITGSRNSETAFWGAVRRNIPRAALALNIRVAASQLSAIPTAAAEVGWGSMLRGFKGVKNLSKSRLEQISQENVWFWQRYRGDGGMREFADMKGGGNFIDKAYNWLDDKTRGWLLNWCQKADVASTAIMHAMAEDWAKKNTGLTPGTDAFKKAVNDKYSLILRNTQPNYTATEAADVLRDKRETVKMFTMFKTQNYQNFNMLYDAMANLRKTSRDLKNKANGVTQADLKLARQRAAAATTSVMIGANLLFSALRLLVNAIMQDMDSYRDENDELNFESVSTTMLSEMLSSISGMVFAGEELYNLVYSRISDQYYYGLNDSAISEISDLVSTAANGDWTKADTYKKLGFGVARVLGIPAQNMTKYYSAVSAWMKDIKNDEIGKFEGSVSRSNSTNYNRMLEASIAGDEAKWNAVKAELLEDPELDEEEILSGYRGKVGDAYKEGELSYDQATDLLIKYGEKSEGDAYWQLDKWDYSIETGSSEDYEKYRELNAALVSGNAASIKAEIKIVDENNDTKTKTVSIVKSAVKDLYVAGTINASQAKNLLKNYCSTENTDYSDANTVYWQMKEWDFAKANDGSSDGYSKYGTFLSSIEKGGSGMQKAAQELLDHGTKKGNIASAIAGQYKEQYVSLYKTNPTKAAQLLEKILDAYVAIGYDRDYERRYIAKNWFKEDDE